MFQMLSRVLGFSSSTVTKRTPKKKARRFQPNLEALEMREVPTATLFKDVNVGPDSSTPQELVNVNGTLFFSADDGIFGRELWMRRGGVVQKVKDIMPGPNGSNPLQLTEVGNRLFFSADDGLHGRELWVTDGTFAGTRLVEDINPGLDSSDPGELTAFAPNPLVFNPTKTDSSATVRLYFAATHSSFGRELWTSRGLDANTFMVRDINPGTPDSSPSYLIVAKTRVRGGLRNVLYFAADRVGLGRELWRTQLNGQAADIVRDIRGGAEGSNPFNLTKVSVAANRADIVFFGADDGFRGAELWRSNGVFGGTFLIEDINPGGPDSDSLRESPTDLMAEFQHRLYFAADDGRVGRELWRSLGGVGSAELFKDINPGVNSSNPTAQEHPLPKLRNLIFRRPNGKDRLLFFGADNGTMGGEPWRANGTFGGTVILRDINVGPASSLIQNELVGIVFPGRLGQPSRILHFAADDGFFGRELWRSDGNINNPIFNTRRDETDINPGAPSSTPSFFEISPGGVFFAAERDLLGRELWRV